MDTGDSWAGRADVGVGAADHGSRAGTDGVVVSGEPAGGVRGGPAGGAMRGSGRGDLPARIEPRSVARLLGGIAGLAALAVLGLALADPTPSRHLRGLLITVDLVCLAGAGTAWLRVVLAVGAPSASKRIE